MVFGRLYLTKEVELLLLLQFVIYQYPGAVPLLIDLALALVLAAARPVQEGLGAPRYGAYEACQFQHTLPAGRAPLEERPRRVHPAHEEGVAADVDDLLYPHVLLDGLDAQAAGEDQDSVRRFYRLPVLRQLKLHLRRDARRLRDAVAGYGLAFLLEKFLHLQYLGRPACLARGGALPAPDDEDLILAFEIF